MINVICRMKYFMETKVMLFQQSEYVYFNTAFIVRVQVDEDEITVYLVDGTDYQITEEDFEIIKSAMST